MAERGEYRIISTDSLQVDEANVRKRPYPLGELEDSIDELGVLEPLLVRTRPQGKFGVVVGTQRFKAAKNVGLQEIPVILRELNDREALEVSLTENIQRGDLHPDDEAEAIAKLYKIYGSEMKTGEALAKSKTWVHERLVAKGIIEKVRQVKGFQEPYEPVLPRDPTKVRHIAEAGKALFPDSPEKQVEVFEALKDRPGAEVRRAVEHIKARAALEPEAIETKPIQEFVDEAFRVPQVKVAMTFGAEVSKAIIRVAEERGLAWEDIVDIAVEDWLRRGGYLG